MARGRKSRVLERVLETTKLMPPLRHSIPGKDFNIQKSEVMKWIMQNPDAWNFIWNNIKQSGSVIYNPDTGTWQGVDYDGD